MRSQSEKYQSSNTFIEHFGIIEMQKYQTTTEKKHYYLPHNTIAFYINILQ